MKRTIPAMLCFVLLCCALGASASAEQAPDWRKEYLDFIVEDYSALAPNDREMTTYQVMQIASDGVPFIYVSHGTTAGGGAFCYVDGDKVVTDLTSVTNFEYIEGSDAYFISGGRMGFYYDSVYALEDGGVVCLGQGAYGAEFGTLLADDTGAVPVNTYTWDDKEVTREEYRREYYGLRDRYLQPEDEIVAVDGYGYGGSSYEEIIAWLLEQGELSDTGTAFSGFYSDFPEQEQVASQVNFDGQNGTFNMLLNLWEDWETVDGTYTVDPSGIIACRPTRIITSSSDEQLDGSDDLRTVYFLMDGDRIKALQGIGGGYEFTRVGDGFTVTPDSGTGTVTGDAVRVRKGPGTEYDIFTELFSGDRVTIIGSSGDWYRIECTDSRGAFFWGFMRSDYIARNQ